MEVREGNLEFQFAEEVQTIKFDDGDFDSQNIGSRSKKTIMKRLQDSINKKLLCFNGNFCKTTCMERSL